METSSPDLVQLRRALIELAAEGRTASYAELVERLAIPQPRAIARLTTALESLAEQDLAAQRPLLSVVVVSKRGIGIPGEGLFLRLAEWGVLSPDLSAPARTEWHRRELARVQAFWPGRLAEDPKGDSLN